jgi:multidrug resistance protein
MFTYITTTTVPSFPSLEEHYALTIDQLNWTVAVPALGLSVGPLFWSSLADIYGRRPIFLLGTIIALASTIGAALAPNYGGYMAARFFQGFGVSPAASVGLAIIGDCFFESERGQKVGLWVLAIDIGLLTGPLIGGFVDLAGFVWIQWLSAILFGVILVLEFFFLPETLYPRDLMLSKRTSSAAAPGQSEKSTASSFSDSALPRTKTLPFLNFKPLPGMKHPNPLSTMWRFFKTFKYLVVPIAVITYCFGW